MSYYKYQNVKTLEEYQLEHHKSKTNESIEQNTKRVIEIIPIFRNCEFDIERLSEEITKFENHLSTCEKYQKKLKSNLRGFISNSNASYLAPAYNYNNYIEYIIQFNIRRKNNEHQLIPHCNDHLATIQVQNIFISIKCLLDRLVSILSFYFNGISVDTTFGRVKKNGKASGLMSTVLSLKETNKYMEFIHKEYYEWIKDIVEPRDIIIHYNDMDIQSHPTADGREFFMHRHIKIFENQETELPIQTPDYEDGHYYKSLMKSVQKLYRFYDITFEVLKNMDIKYKKSHFIEKVDYELYKNNGYKF